MKTNEKALVNSIFIETSITKYLSVKQIKKIAFLKDMTNRKIYLVKYCRPTHIFFLMKLLLK